MSKFELKQVAELKAELDEAKQDLKIKNLAFDDRTKYDERVIKALEQQIAQLKAEHERLREALNMIAFGEVVCEEQNVQYSRLNLSGVRKLAEQALKENKE